MTATLWDPETQISVPPIDAVFPVEVGTLWTAVYAGLAAAVLLYALWNVRDFKGRIIILFMIGGLINAINEPILDILTNCWHSEIGQPTAFTLFGRDMPWWVPMVYMFYFGAVGGLNVLAFRRGVSRMGFWLWYLVPLALDVAMEEAMLAQELYHYYGNQPLVLLSKFPLWYAFANSLAETSAVVIVVWLLPQLLRGGRLLYVVLIPPVTMATVYATVCAPVIYAINQEAIAPWMAQAAGLVSVGLCCWVVHGLSHLVVREPHDAPVPAVEAAAPRA